MKLYSSIWGQGPIIIILHGLFGESKNWISIAKELASDFEVHLVDQRNHGNSFHHPEHNYIILAEDLKNYIEQKKIDQYSIIGHSMGGKVAMQFAFLYPNKLKKLIIVDIAPKNYKGYHSKIFKGLKKVLLESQSRKSAQKILLNFINDIVTTNFLLKGLSFKEDNTPQLRFNFNALEHNMDNMLSELKTSNIFNGMTHFISGALSDYIRDTDIKYISGLFSFYKIIEIKNAGHWVHHDNKPEFLKAIYNIFKD